MKKGHIKSKAGFTLVEAMVATCLFGLVVAGAFEVYIMCSKVYHSTSLTMQATRESMLAVSRMVYGMETNNGLRAASLVIYQTNAYGHPYPFISSYKYWETGASPPSASDSSYYTHIGCVYGTDGSWRLIFSNLFDGVHCVDYNSEARALLFCPDTNQTATARQKRILICNYVSAAQIQTNISGMNGTISIKLTVEKKEGRFISSNTVTTIVKMRNQS